jgi:protein-disulfide isomerase
MNTKNTNYKIKGSLDVPTAIVIAGAIIGVSLVYALSKNGDSTANPPLAQIKDAVLDNQSFKNLTPVSEKDHIFGDPNAPIKIVEFSDTECPFCKKFHETMHKIAKDYDGKVAWVYRSFPLDSLHTKALAEAVALECAADLGGNAKFWAYLDRLMEITPSNDGLNLEELPRIAKYISLDGNKFTSCQNSGKFDAIVETQYQDGIASGAEGTPYSVIVKDGAPIDTIEGAYPYSSVKESIDKALAE